MSLTLLEVCFQFWTAIFTNADAITIADFRLGTGEIKPYLARVFQIAFYVTVTRASE